MRLKRNRGADLRHATGNAEDDRAERDAALAWRERFLRDIFGDDRMTPGEKAGAAAETGLCIAIIAICVWGLIALESRAEPRPGATHAMVLVMEMPDAKTCGEAILSYVGQGDVFFIERDDDEPSAPASSPMPRPRPATAED